MDRVALVTGASVTLGLIARLLARTRLCSTLRSAPLPIRRASALAAARTLADPVEQRVAEAFSARELDRLRELLDRFAVAFDES